MENLEKIFSENAQIPRLQKNSNPPGNIKYLAKDIFLWTGKTYSEDEKDKLIKAAPEERYAFDNGKIGINVLGINSNADKLVDLYWNKILPCRFYMKRGNDLNKYNPPGNKKSRESELELKWLCFYPSKPDLSSWLAFLYFLSEPYGYNEIYITEDIRMSIVPFLHVPIWDDFTIILKPGYILDSYCEDLEQV